MDYSTLSHHDLLIIKNWFTEFLKYSTGRNSVSSVEVYATLSYQLERIDNAIRNLNAEEQDGK